MFGCLIDFLDSTQLPKFQLIYENKASLGLVDSGATPVRLSYVKAIHQGRSQLRTYNFISQWQLYHEFLLLPIKK